MKIADGLLVGKTLCELFGIDPKEITEITIHASIQEMATIEIKKLVDVEKLGQVTKHYIVQEIKES